VLGQVGIVLGAHQADVVGAVVSAQAEGVNVVVLEVVSRLAPPPRRVDVTASASVSLVYGPANRCGNAPRGGRRVGRRQVLAGPRRRSEAAGLEPFQLLGDGRLDDRAEIPVGDLRAHESLKPGELLAEHGTGGELHPKPPGGEGLDDGRRGMRTRRA
jgi:hypothetical protein